MRGAFSLPLIIAVLTEIISKVNFAYKNLNCYIKLGWNSWNKKINIYGKRLKKSQEKKSNIINNVLTENKSSPKSRQQIYSENYQKNKERKKQQRRQRYQQEKEQVKEQSVKYYQASNIKVLISLKEYTKLNQQKRKLWLDFTATLHQLSQGITTIEEVMRLEQLADQLIKDYWETAKGKVRQGIRSWNNLEPEQQSKLIKYWGYEKVRIENNFLTAAERLEQEGEQYEKDIEIAKFHEERGKKGCQCWQCAEQKIIQKEVKAKIKKDTVDYDRQNKATNKEKCPECKKWVKELAEESGVCKKCLSKYET